MISNALIGLKTELRELDYTWRDVSLYALAVGAKAEDLIYTYEKEMKALPTFGVLPYWSTAVIKPHSFSPRSAAILVLPYLPTVGGGLHMDHELIMHRPIDPIKGSFLFEDIITNIYDRGSEKGIVVKTKAAIHDEASNLICTNIASTGFFTGGGFGGEPQPNSPVVIPDRAPDHEANDYISPTQNLLYRLTGDLCRVHVDIKEAQRVGQPKPFMHGLCSYGFACRMATQCFFPYEPERVTRIAAQMRNVLFPDTPIKLLLWKTGDNQAYFRLLNAGNGKPILERGVFEWK